MEDWSNDGRHVASDERRRAGVCELWNIFVRWKYGIDVHTTSARSVLVRQRSANGWVIFDRSFEWCTYLKAVGTSAGNNRIIMYALHDVCRTSKGVVTRYNRLRHDEFSFFFVFLSVACSRLEQFATTCHVCSINVCLPQPLEDNGRRCCPWLYPPQLYCCDRQVTPSLSDTVYVLLTYKTRARTSFIRAL